jgi:hypothetical protein
MNEELQSSFWPLIRRLINMKSNIYQKNKPYSPFPYHFPCPAIYCSKHPDQSPITDIPPKLKKPPFVQILTLLSTLITKK